ncbi:MAG: AbrB/MazE/SpoVT family DNA-binding domain-containing protein [Spirochaetaceae bacterium]|nr:MAG: AbrB/MazE/SpoVT family DNA-binding domain-containing protein [Spirochaetaceae bacterium]
MLCKMTSKNQLTLPKEVLRHCQDQSYFDARWESGRIVLEPVVIRPLESPQLAAIRDKVDRLGIGEADLAGIVAEARRAYGS